MDSAKTLKRLTDHIVTIALIRKAINNKDLISREKIELIDKHINDLDKGMKEIDNEK